MNWIYGKEGVHWEWDNEPYKGGFTALKDIPAEYPKLGGFFTNYPNYNPSWVSDWSAKSNFAVFNKYEFDNFGDQWFGTHRIDAYNETDYNDVWERKGGAMRTLQDEFFANAIKGEIDVDAEWDNYVQTWYDYGGTELMAEVQKMPLFSDVYGK